MSGAPLRVVVIDDEPLAVRRLRAALQRLPGVELVGASTSPSKARQLIRTRAADVLLLDVQMPGLSGLQLLETLGPEPPVVIFVTAHASFAAQAFEVAAVDYLLKPVESARLRRALERARQALAARTAQQRLAELQLELTRRPEIPADGFDQELWVPDRGQTVRLPVELIDWIEAEREYVRIHSRGRSFLVRRSIRDLQGRLDPEAFIRVHRGALVRRDRVVRFASGPGGPASLVLQSGAEIPVSRRSLAGVRRLLRRG